VPLSRYESSGDKSLSKSFAQTSGVKSNATVVKKRKAAKEPVQPKESPKPLDTPARERMYEEEELRRKRMLSQLIKNNKEALAKVKASRTGLRNHELRMHTENDLIGRLEGAEQEMSKKLCSVIQSVDLKTRLEESRKRDQLARSIRKNADL